MMANYSKNKRAEQVMGLRPTDGIAINWPCEDGYHCPVCKYENLIDGEYDTRLEWSEYNAFIWCEVCNKDYPSCLCVPDIDKAILVFLNSVEAATTTALAGKE